MPKRQAKDAAIVSLAQVARSLEASLPVLTERVLEQVWGIPGYDEQHLDRAELAGYTTPNLLAVIRSLAHTGAPPPESVATAERIGEVRALQGVPIDAMIRSWSTAGRVLLDQLLSDAGQLPATELRAAVARLGETFAHLTQHSVDTYHRIQDEVTAHYDRLTADLVARLAGEQPADPDEVRSRARTIGVDPSIEYAALALSVGLPEPGSSAPDDAARDDGSRAKAYLRVQRHLLATVAPRTPGRVLVGSVGEFPLLLVPAPGGMARLEERLQAALASAQVAAPVLVGIGTTVAALPYSGESCQQAKEALDVGRRLGWSDRIVSFRDVAAEILLIRSPDVAAALRDRLAPIVRRPELLQTLTAYLANGLSARATARSLFVHPNTVPYRLKQLQRLLDNSLADVTAMTDLILALRASELFADGADAEEPRGSDWPAAEVDGDRSAPLARPIAPAQ